MSSADISTMESTKNPTGRLPESRKTTFLFFSFGFLEYLVFGVVAAGAEDLLTGLSSSTGVIWILLLLPFTVLPNIMPYVFDRLPPLCFVLSTIPLSGIGLGLTFLLKIPWLRFLGVFLLGTSQALSEVTAVSSTAYFDSVTVKYYCAGTGLGYFLGPLYYTAMTSWLRISFNFTIPVVASLEPVLFLMCFLMLENRRENARNGYQSVNTESTKAHDYQNLEHLTLAEKLRSAFAILPEITAIFLGIFAHNLVLSGVTTTIAFSNSPFSPSDHYVYYLIMSFAGLCLGRSYLGIVEYIKPGLLDKILVRQSGFLVAIAILHVILLILDSLYKFIPNVWIIFFLVFSLGFWAEAVYANVNVLILGEIEDSRVRELSMGLAVFGLGFGGLMGAIISTPVEKVLLKHCLKVSNLNETNLCLTRKIVPINHIQ